MTSEERLQRMAELIRQINETERAKREASKAFRDELAGYWKELERLGLDVESGQMSIGEDDDPDDGTTVSFEHDGKRTDAMPVKQFVDLSKKVAKGVRR